MSYCVNCGVELEAAQKNCPLCGVEVINPREPHKEEKTTYPKERDEFKKKDRIFWIKFISVVLAVPIATCIISDLIISGRLSWSVFVIAGAFLAWVLATSPMYSKHFSIVKMLFFDLTATIASLFIIEAATGKPGWVLPIALPICVYIFLSGLLIIYLYRHFNLSGLGIASALLIGVGIMMPALEAAIDLFMFNGVSLYWSWLVAAPCLFVAAFLAALGSSKRFKSELEKRLHI